MERKNLGLHILFEDESKLIEYKEQNQFTAGFFNNIFLRPSCYTCSYANTERVGDITLGDFWGYIETSDLDRDTDEGISMVMINTENGAHAYNGILRHIYSFQRTIQEAVDGNPTLSAPSSKGVEYDAFWRDINNYSVEEVLDKYCKPSKIIWDEVARYVLIHHNKCPGVIKRVLRLYYFSGNHLFKNHYYKKN